uniref:ATP-dependent DNA helicase n=1 Tax=Chromera velia CCMP2878 TaxID=1169474 RepID=A0A0G4FAZ5_9ALVE|eukprot:Cvel_16088.t1-p1 / transcript=Cvel_16088.t1 / gene=Cvel_16088 / organism=Chromera_velia_CCMP2878 / gene_product=ATP-dependent zinc metalloprotease FtsH, putative / transcript_product=ATP-dependent zinc metalloprotease FtsH, putative / location=Cvel_scaffold1223:28603-48520(+) / protein_length=1169 / sequence_SO=supercontig / SO=protein_coding / is_pseudo=false
MKEAYAPHETVLEVLQPDWAQAITPIEAALVSKPEFRGTFIVGAVEQFFGSPLSDHWQLLVHKSCTRLHEEIQNLSSPLVLLYERYFYYANLLSLQRRHSKIEADIADRKKKEDHAAVHDPYGPQRQAIKDNCRGGLSRDDEGTYKVSFQKFEQKGPCRPQALLKSLIAPTQGSSSAVSTGIITETMDTLKSRIAAIEKRSEQQQSDKKKPRTNPFLLSEDTSVTSMHDFLYKLSQTKLDFKVAEQKRIAQLNNKLNTLQQPSDASASSQPPPPRTGSDKSASIWSSAAYPNAQPQHPVFDKDFLKKLIEDEIDKYTTKLNDLQRLAVRICFEGLLSADDEELDSIWAFIRGEGGTGKSEVIHTILDVLKSLSLAHLCRTSAPTGIVSIAVEGRTTASLFHKYHQNDATLGQVPRQKKQLEENMVNVKLLFLDKLSMLGLESLGLCSNRIMMDKGAGEQPVGFLQSSHHASCVRRSRRRQPPGHVCSPHPIKDDAAVSKDPLEKTLLEASMALPAVLLATVLDASASQVALSHSSLVPVEMTSPYTVGQFVQRLMVTVGQFLQPLMMTGGQFVHRLMMTGGQFVHRLMMTLTDSRLLFFATRLVFFYAVFRFASEKLSSAMKWLEEGQKKWLEEGPPGSSVKELLAKFVSKNTTFSDVVGLEEAKEELKEIADMLKYPKKYRQLDARIPAGVLLTGPPGCGKTLLAKALAGETDTKFISVSGADLTSMFMNVASEKLQKIFKAADQEKRCIVFMDEFDTIAKQRFSSPGSQGASMDNDATVNTILTAMDGFHSRAQEGNVTIVIAATNRPQTLDEAVTRAGRFDRKIRVGLPSKEGRKSMLELYLRKVPMSNEAREHLQSLADRTTGWSGALLESTANEAKLNAGRRCSWKDAGIVMGGTTVIPTGRNTKIVYGGGEIQSVEGGRIAEEGEETEGEWDPNLRIEVDDLERAWERVLMGPRTIGQGWRAPYNAQRNRCVAVHEAGHALVASLIPDGPVVESVSIVPRLGIAEDEGGIVGGFTSFRQREGNLESSDSLKAQLATSYGGRAAEEEVFGAAGTTPGASADIESATKLAKQMVGSLGFSPLIGPVHMPSLGEAAETEMSREVQVLLTEAYDRAKKLMRDNRPLLDTTTELLLKKEDVSGSELRELVKELGKRSVEEVKSESQGG